MCPVATDDVTTPLQKGQAYTYSAAAVFSLLLACKRLADAMSAERISTGSVE
jgi:hypothetical protein